MPSICFVESTMYSVLNPGFRRSSSGGEAVQTTLLAREFARQGWDVHAVCRDVGQPDGEVIDGVRVWKTFRFDAGLPGMKFLYPRLLKEWRALGKADADIYFQSCAGHMTGIVARYVHKAGKGMIFRVAHDTDCIPGQQLIKNRRDRWLYEYGLRSADLISVQSRYQAAELEKNYGLSSVLVNMVVGAPAESAAERDIDVLWVNNFRPFKRPELLIDIAKQLPDVKFAMIGGRMRGAGELFDEVKHAAKGLPNLDFIGPVPYSDVNDYFARAKLFLNTSDSEGFPNSFLQAWIRSVPVISFFDPDGLIESRGLGIKAASQDAFCEPIRRLLASDETREEMGRQACKFANDNYSAEAIVGRYAAMMRDKFELQGGHD